MTNGEMLILSLILFFCILMLIAVILYARAEAFEQQRVEDDLRTQYNTEDVITHYGLPCTDPDCECA